MVDKIYHATKPTSIYKKKYSNTERKPAKKDVNKELRIIKELGIMLTEKEKKEAFEIKTVGKLKDWRHKIVIERFK